MLETILGCTLFAKLRAILLMEADFNHFNNNIFGHRMLVNAIYYGLMPEEVYSACDKVPYDGTLAKVIFNDVVRQTRG